MANFVAVRIQLVFRSRIVIGVTTFAFLAAAGVSKNVNTVPRPAAIREELARIK